MYDIVFNYLMFIKSYLTIIFTNLVQNCIDTIDIITEPQMPVYVYKVIAYDNLSESQIDLTNSFFSSSDYFSKITFENDSRIEYRFKFKNQKYRHVSIYNPKTPSSTNFLDFSLLFKKVPFKTRIVSAYLVSSVWCNDTDSWIVNDREDVLYKIKKYLGPNHDFFSSKITPSWLFPSEDFQDGQELHLINSNGISSVVKMDSLSPIIL